MRLPVRHLSAVALSAIALVACGGDDDETATEPATGATGTTDGVASAAADAAAQSTARNAQTALEVYFTDNQTYSGADPQALGEIEPSLPSDIEVEAEKESFSITVPSESGNSFTIERDANGEVTHTCTEPGVGDCPENGEW